MQTSIEREHVQNVYEHIAQHFSKTRYKPWPSIDAYFKNIPTGSLVMDVGCGNGKYLGCNTHVCAIGCDQSTNLARVCSKRGFNCFIADGLRLPCRSQAFVRTYCSPFSLCIGAVSHHNPVDKMYTEKEYVVCVAVIHHYSTVENREAAIRELRRIVKINGEILITAWALKETTENSSQDVMVAWHLHETSSKSTSKQCCKGRSAWHDQEVQNELTCSAQTGAIVEKKVFHRYYHLFKEGELENLCQSVGGLGVIKSFWELDNWYLFLRRIE